MSLQHRVARIEQVAERSESLLRQVEPWKPTEYEALSRLVAIAGVGREQFVSRFVALGAEQDVVERVAADIFGLRELLRVLYARDGWVALVESIKSEWSEWSWQQAQGLASAAVQDLYLWLLDTDRAAFEAESERQGEARRRWWFEDNARMQRTGAQPEQTT